MRIALLTLALVGCDNGLSDLTPLDTDGDTGVDSDGIVDVDTEADSDTEADTDADTTPPPIVRFVALGDAGDNPTHQADVADAIETTCAARGCDFALYLGDNFYDSGLSSYTDPRFQTNFEVPYADLNFPFFIVLGNHDLGGEGLGLDADQDKANYQVDYTAQSTRWTMPSEYYSISGTAEVPSSVLRIIGLDTTRMFFGNTLGTLDIQQAWLSSELAANTSPWTIGFGHHPYVSNGKHGNAGVYEGSGPLGDIIPFNAEIRGKHVKDLFDEVGCGAFDVYFSGHDHNRQLLPEPTGCDTLFVVSGAGAKHSDFHGSILRPENDTLFQDDQERGFVWVEIDGNTMTLVFVDEDGDEHGPFLHYR